MQRSITLCIFRLLSNEKIFQVSDLVKVKWER